MIETVITLTCSCGWMTDCATVADALDEFDTHANGDTLYHVYGPPTPISNPSPYFPVIRASNLRDAEERRALMFIEREEWRYAEPTLDREDMGLGCFRGMWNVVKLYFGLTIAALCIYGLVTR